MIDFRGQTLIQTLASCHTIRLPMPPDSLNERPQSIGEELANTLSHGAGLLAAVAALPVLVVAASRQGDLAGLIGFSVFGVSMVLLYLSSTLYHAIPHSDTKDRFQVLDHMAIFLLIAGTYTPFMLGVLRGTLGWTLLGLVWGIALFGIMLKAIHGVRFETLSTGLYLGAGWLAVIAIVPLWNNLPGWGFFWLLAGGVFYSVGVIFFVAERYRYFHFIWHLFVLAGTGSHFIAVLYYSGAPAASA